MLSIGTLHQHRTRVVSLLVTALITVMTANAAAAQPVAISNVKPFLQAFCVPCHDQTVRVGGLMFDAFDWANVSRDAHVWEKVLRQLRARTMPPSLARTRPDDAMYRTAIDEISRALDRADQLRPRHTLAPRLTGPELANRLAMFLWSGVPDDELRQLGAANKLTDGRVLEQQARRMLRDPRSAAFATDFVVAYLRIPTPDGPFRTAFDRETRLFVEDQIRRDADVMEMWLADYSLMNGTVAAHYGIGGVGGDEYRPVKYPDDTRGGLLGHASFLAATSPGERTSTIMRGAKLLDLFFGVGFPAPPASLPVLSFQGPSRRVLDEAYQARRCQGCHYIGQLGAALEGFDHRGRWRTMDGMAVDASGRFPDGTSFATTSDLRRRLAEGRDAFVTTLTERALAHALGRGPEGRQVQFFEMPAVRQIVQAARASGDRWSSIVVGVVLSPWFQIASSPPPPTVSPNISFAGTWNRKDGSAPPFIVTQTDDVFTVPRGSRRWTYHINRWGVRHEPPGGDKLVQARWDGDKLIVIAAPTVRAGTVAEVWSVNASGTELTIESTAMSEATFQFDFRESSISPVYARTRVVYVRAPNE